MSNIINTATAPAMIAPYVIDKKMLGDSDQMKKIYFKEKINALYASYEIFRTGYKLDESFKKFLFDSIAYAHTDINKNKLTEIHKSIIIEYLTKIVMLSSTFTDSTEAPAKNIALELFSAYTENFEKEFINGSLKLLPKIVKLFLKLIRK